MNRPDRCVHHLFAEVVASFASRAALVHNGRTVSYGELDRWSNRLARRLLLANVRPDEVVAICTGRSFEMVVSVLAVHKVGAAYLPLDPSLPPERFAFMLSDAGARVLLTQRSLSIEPIAASASRLFVEDDDSALSAEALTIEVTPKHLAYVIYTSGSTGTPKGIEMPHDVLANLLEWQRASYTWRPDARWAQYSAFFFDASFVDIYATLISGGTLYLLSEELRTNFDALCGLFREQKVERTYIPMVALSQLAEAACRPGAAFPADLREVIVSGEQLKITDKIRELFERLGPEAVLHNQYGPAETHVVTAFALRHPPSTWADLPSIGTPIWKSRIYLLDANLHAVADGVAGDLYIGATVARGYRGRAGTTAEKFLPDPFDSSPGGVMYRSGDVAVRHADGTYEFRGRADFQLKIRGYRVEPLEIELTLANHPGVGLCAVAAFKDTSGQNSLVGYVVPATHDRDATSLRRYLEQRLPDYMVPARFVFVDTLPLTPSGKLDRRALPQPEPEPPAIDTRLTEVRDPVEAVLVRLWCQTFNLAELGVDDDFFELGGHSLMALGLISKTREIFGVEFSLLTLFAAPTIAGMLDALLQAAERPDQLTVAARQWLAGQIAR